MRGQDVSAITACKGHTETSGACDATCDPHTKERNRLRSQQERIEEIAYRLHKEGRDDEASDLYSLSSEVWDDAIHVSSPLNGHISLCGKRGRNLVKADEQMPDGWSGCWTCLSLALPEQPGETRSNPESSRSALGKSKT